MFPDVSPKKGRRLLGGDHVTGGQSFLECSNRCSAGYPVRQRELRYAKHGATPPYDALHDIWDRQAVETNE